MPLLFRLMKADGEKPNLGQTSMCLGARVPKDIQPDAQGMVNSGDGGISVSAKPEDLTPAMIPERYAKTIRGAASRVNSVWIWRMGEGDFVSGPVANRLALRIDPLNNKHGFVEQVLP